MSLAQTEIQDIEAEIAALRKRSAKLDELLTLRREVVQKQVMIDHGNIIPKIVEVFCDEFGVSSAQLFSRCREEGLVLPRHLLCKFFREEMHFPFAKIASMLGSNCHATVIHALRSVEARLTTEPKLADRYKLLRQQALNLIKK